METFGENDNGTDNNTANVVRIQKGLKWQVIDAIDWNPDWIDIVSDFPIDTEFTSLSLRDLYIDIHGPQSAPTARQIGRMLSLSDIVGSKPESLWIRK